MFLGIVVGTVTATRKADTLSGSKFLLIQPQKSASEVDKSNVVVAVDLLGAGTGEGVIVATGRAARIAIGKDDVPVDAAVIGIVDAGSAR
ncbi:MAG TPA: EutN/CcmL family microcompartment protein [Planctomycetota bacterium]|nr:EutN/CcmL family microcompartment protein [Planctomycetota bacterium]